MADFANVSAPKIFHILAGGWAMSSSRHDDIRHRTPPGAALSGFRHDEFQPFLPLTEFAGERYYKFQ
ncbi:hypothetical protein [Actinospica sp.]|jgi:hypothetical protein|uniref:hypothetical protein n=1 Tax=Actinospica sp. TaxID=1872142 RepID=UPI002C31B07B|nr:hypothetical protein [Actinospica sp.]HWG26813.1 hypothetical protein [Actinospica sp.]